MESFELPDDIIIRDYLDEDYDEVLNLWYLTEMGSSIRGDTKETVRRTLDSGGKLLIMESISGKLICGSSWMTSDGRRILLHHFGVLPEFQGKGLSKILLRESLKFVKEKGLQVKLEVHSSNIRAINLYRQFGFEELVDFNVYIIRDLSNL